MFFPISERSHESVFVFSIIFDLFASAQPVPEKRATRHRNIKRVKVFLMLVIGTGIKTKATTITEKKQYGIRYRVHGSRTR